MDTGVAIILIVALVVIGVGAWIYIEKQRTSQLRRKFGPEYDRVVGDRKDRRRAERVLEMRERRVARLPIRPLTEADAQHFADAWRLDQVRFVDDPKGAVAEADRLVAEVMNARGYPVADFEQRAEDVSVDHPTVVENYRCAHDIALRHERGEASTEDLRQAMVYYRALFDELLADSMPRRKAV